MRYSSEHGEETRQRILRAAARSFRAYGYSGVGVDGIAKAAGITSGAFYGHFSSKSDAFREAVSDGMDRLRSGIERFQSEDGVTWTRAMADYYLSDGHRSDVPNGCALPSLSAEVSRADEQTKQVYKTGLKAAVTAFANGLPTGTEQERTATAWAVLAMLAGGVTLARAVGNEAVADQIADAVHRAMLSATSQ